MKFVKLGLVCGLTMMAAGSAWADDTALVISNTDYRYARDLSDTVNHRQVLSVMRNAGYQVIDGADLRTVGLVTLAQQAQANLADGDKLVIVVQGYFSTFSGDPVLLGSRMRDPNRFNVQHSGLSMGAILDLAGDYQGRALVAVVDPDGRSLGDAPFGPLVAPQGVTLVQGAGRDIGGFLNAVFGRNADTVADAAATFDQLDVTGYVPSAKFGGDGGGSDTLTEQDFWAVVQTIDTVEGYTAYMEKYPRGEFTSPARRAIVFIEDAPERAAQAAEAALNLSKRDRAQVQQDLTLLGFDTRGVDGVFGRGSRAAIANWQTSMGFTANGFLTGNQVLEMRRLAKIKQAALDEAAAEQAETLQEQDRDYWWGTGRGRTEEGLRDYLKRFPNGEFADVARDKLLKFAPAQPFSGGATQAQMDADMAQERQLAANPITRLLIEKGLERLQLNPGRVDGRFDAKTRAAIKAFQRGANLPETGYVGQGTAVKLLNNQ